MIEIKTEEDFKKFINSKEVSLVDFYAPWCGPCRALHTSLLELDSKNDPENSDKKLINIAKVDVDQNPDIVKAFGIRSLPTMVLFKEGKALSSKIGNQQINEIYDWIIDEKA